VLSLQYHFTIMSSKFWYFSLVFWFYLYSSGQNTKTLYYQQKITACKDNKTKLKYLDSLAHQLYSCGCDSKIKHKYIGRLIESAHQNQNESIFIEACLLKAKLFFRQGAFEKGIETTEKIKKFCSRKKNKMGLIRAEVLEGRIYNRIDRYKLSLKNYQSAIANFKNIDTLGDRQSQKILINLYANMARLYMNLHQDSLADVYHIKTIELAHKIHDYERISFFYNILGWKYFVLNNYKMAKTYFLKGLKDSAKIKNKIYNISNHHALGIIYDKLGNLNKALYHDSIALNFFIKTNNNSFKSSIYNNIAKAYMNHKQADQALLNNKKAIGIAKKHGLVDNLISAKLTLAQILIQTKKYDAAQQVLLNLMNQNSTKSKMNKKQKMLYYQLLAAVFAFKKEPMKAYKFENLYSKYADSVYKRSLKALSGTETKYQNEFLKRRMLLKQQEIVRQKRLKNKLIYGNLFLAFLIILGLYFTYTFSKKYKLQKQQYEKTLHKIEALNAQLFQKKQNQEQLHYKQDFRTFLKNKYNINKTEIIEIWESIAQGISRSEYVQKNNINENTVKAWRKELYAKLKQHTQTHKFSDYKAVIEYFKSLRDFEYFSSK